MLGLPARLGGTGSGNRIPVLPINSSGNRVGNRQKLSDRVIITLKKIVQFEASKRVEVARSGAVPDAVLDAYPGG